MNDRLKTSDDGSHVQTTALLGVSPEICRVRDQVRRLADTRLSVLLTGETGVGKQLVAREIHRTARASGERPGPLLILHCADVLSGGQLDGVPLGQTPAHPQARLEDLFELASRGTLFVDGVDELPPPSQARLLRLLDAREVGSAGTPADVRIIASANGLRERSSLRSGLYYGFECVVELPPLRARSADVRLLAEHFLAELGSAQQLSPAAYQALQQYPWPGNVRELQSLIRNVAALHGDRSVITPECLFGEDVRLGEPAAAEQDGLLDDDWKQAQEKFARWYWTNLWRRFGGQPQRILEHAHVSHVWLRSLQKRFGLGMAGG